MVHLFQRKAELNALEATVISVRTSPAPPAARDKTLHFYKREMLPMQFSAGTRSLLCKAAGSPPKAA